MPTTLDPKIISQYGWAAIVGALSLILLLVLRWLLGLFSKQMAEWPKIVKANTEALVKVTAALESQGKINAQYAERLSQENKRHAVELSREHKEIRNDLHRLEDFRGRGE